MKNSYYPIMMDISDKKCVVIGGGKVAIHKVKGLVGTGATVDVISPVFNDKLIKLASKDDNITMHERKYEYGDLKGAYLAFICTDISEVNNECLKEARELGIMVNMAENQDDCDFIVPAKIVKGGLSIGITTSGNSPALTKKIKRDIDSMLHKDMDVYIDALGKLRELVKREVPDIKMRKKILNKVVKDNIITGYEDVDPDNIYDELMNIYLRYKEELNK